MSTIITHRQFPGYHKYEMELAGRPLTLEVGKLAELANAAVMVGYGDTRVLVCATASARPRDGIDFFPLSVDFEEKMYSVGRIPGSFNRREGRPGEKGILTSRVIDRPIRPLFPYDFRNDVSIMATVMAVDHDCSPEIAALIGTSAALAISDIPWNGPVGALKVGLVNGELVLNPTSEQRKVKYKVGDEGSVVRISTGETVSTKKYVVKTSGPALNFRSVYNGTVSGRLETGDTVRVIEKGDRWAYLLIDGEVYTAMSAYLVEPEAAVEAPEEAPAEEQTGMTEEDFRALVNAIEITFRFEGDSVAYGDTVTLVAHIPEALSGAEIQWHTQTPGGDWTNVEGAFGTTLSIVASESNASNIWRVQLTLG